MRMREKECGPRRSTKPRRIFPMPGRVGGRSSDIFLRERGGRQRPNKYLASMLDQFERGLVSAADIATIYSGLGDKQSAFAWIDRIDTEHGTLVVDRLALLLETLRSDP